MHVSRCSILFLGHRRRLKETKKRGGDRFRFLEVDPVGGMIQNEPLAVVAQVETGSEEMRLKGDVSASDDD